MASIISLDGVIYVSDRGDLITIIERGSDLIEVILIDFMSIDPLNQSIGSDQWGVDHFFKIFYDQIKAPRSNH